MTTNKVGALSVCLLSTGGTIASVASVDGPGLRPALTAEDLCAQLPAQAVGGVRLRAQNVSSVPSIDITLEIVRQIVDEAAAAIDKGCVGAVVTQGTDTIEESAFLMDLLWDRAEPLVVTGAMRSPCMPGSDALANVAAAVRTAVTPDLRDAGVVVVMNDQVHAARHVTKSHTSQLSAFTSPGVGPIADVTEGRVEVSWRPRRIRLPAGTRTAPFPRVALVRAAMDDDLVVLTSLQDFGYDGAVIEGLGGGHVPQASRAHVEQLVSQMPTVLVSRTGGGRILEKTYGFRGGEIDLLSLGMISGGRLTGVKARVALAACLAGHLDEAAIRTTLGEFT